MNVVDCYYGVSYTHTPKAEYLPTPLTDGTFNDVDYLYGGCVISCSLSHATLSPSEALVMSNIKKASLYVSEYLYTNTRMICSLQQYTISMHSRVFLGKVVNMFKGYGRPLTFSCRWGMWC